MKRLSYLSQPGLFIYFADSTIPESIISVEIGFRKETVEFCGSRFVYSIRMCVRKHFVK